MFIKSVNRNLFVLFFVIAFGCLSSGVALAAWAPNFTSAPYYGNFYLSTNANHQVSTAQNVKWNVYGVGQLVSDSGPKFDITADCSANSPASDQLAYSAFFTNVPNTGLTSKNDCGVWFGPHEETELAINASAVQAELEYYHQVHFSKNQSGVSGEINLTYQRSNSPTHDHIEKVLYSN